MKERITMDKKTAITRLKKMRRDFVMSTEVMPMPGVTEIAFEFIEAIDFAIQAIEGSGEWACHLSRGIKK